MHIQHTHRKEKKRRREIQHLMMSPSYIISSLFFLFSFRRIFKKKRKAKEKPSHSIPPPLIGATLLYACVVRHPRKTHTQTFNQMCVMHTHSLTVSKEEGEKNAVSVVCDRPSNLSIGLLMIIATIRYLTNGYGY